MQYVGRFVSSVYNTITPNINPATLSGAIDVIVVERTVEKEVEDENGVKSIVKSTEYASTPFHVRFGKMSVLRPAERKVTLHLNNASEPLPFAMKVGEAGEAFFVEELNDDEARQGLSDDMVTSPILTASNSPALGASSNGSIHGFDAAANHRPPRKLIEEDFVEPLDLAGPNLSEEEGVAEETLTKEDIEQRMAEAQKAIEAMDLEGGLISQSTINKRDRRPSLGATNSAPALPILHERRNSGTLAESSSEKVLMSKDDAGGDFNAGAQKTRTSPAFGQHEFEGSEASTVKSGETRESDETAMTSPSTFGDLTEPKPAVERAHTVPIAAKDSAVTRQQKTYAKTLRLTSDQLRSLNLKKGANSISFSVTSSYSGVATCSSRIFLWESTHQVVVSDIDGTITKSDALGHVYTMIGRDWTHSGVAKLYCDIVRNGYKIMYLTSRAIGQADTTRDYLRGVKQGNFRLPDGPVIMSPDRLMASLHREVILRKPEVFKMACLRDIARLFGADPRTAPVQPGNSLPHHLEGAINPADGGAAPLDGEERVGSDSAAALEAGAVRRGGIHLGTKPTTEGGGRPTPFYAGFGNRITDALSYRSVNVPSSRIFTIDHNSEVKMELLELAGYKSSYMHMTDLVDQMFPPITERIEKGNVTKPEFNDFNFWRPDLTEFDLPADDELIHTPLASSPVSPALSARSVRSNASARSSASTTKLRTVKSDDGQLASDVASTKTMPPSTNEESSSGSRLSRFGLGKLGLSRRGSAHTMAIPPSSLSSGDAQREQRERMATSPSTKSMFNTSPPSSPGSYGSGVTSWTAGWRRRAASPGANSGSGVQATSPLVGPVISATDQDLDVDGDGDEDDDVSSLGEDDLEEEEEQDDEEGEAGHAADTNDRTNTSASAAAAIARRNRHRRARTLDDMGDEVLNDDDDDDDDLLATGEIRFDWRK
jgi:phosphatidate phosphatase PAH1